MTSLKTNLYLDQIDLKRYCPNAESPSTSGQGITCLDACPLMNAAQIKACRLALEASSYLPDGPPVTVPQPVDPGLIALNDPDENALVLVSGNSRITFEVLVAVWSQGVTPAYLLLVDCLGHTVDMAMVFSEFTSQRLEQAIKGTNLEGKVAHQRLVVPGLTAPLAAAFADATGWEIEVGPVCAAELPLFLGERWIFAE